MDKKIEEYMRKVRDYYVADQGQESTLSTKDVLSRILSHSGGEMDWETSESKMVDGMLLDLELEAFDRHREEANLRWGIGSEKPIASHRRVIGRFIVLFKKALRKMIRWYISPIVEEQNEFNAQVTGALNEMGNKLIAIQSNFEQTHRKFSETYVQIEEAVDESNIKIEEAVDELNIKIKEAVDESNNKIKDSSESFQTKLEQIKLEVGRTVQAMLQIKNRYESDYSYLTYRLKSLGKDRIENTDKPAEQIHKNAPEPDGSPIDGSIGPDYFLFENRFRGSESEIKENLRQYLPYFTHGPILDIGCGRGEFLSLLAEKNIEAKGIDIYPDFVFYCQGKGLDVIKNDAVSYLEGLEDNTLGGIFLGQVIEHLKEAYLMRLLALSYRKLKPGACFIAETPNPTMLSTLSNSFYLDMSHERPVHPETMRFLMGYYGFNAVDIVFSKPSKIPYDLPVLEGDAHIQNLQAFNDGINLLNSLLFGYQDYAVVGRK